MQGVALAIAHRDTRVTHVVGYPVGKYGNLAHRVADAAQELVDLGLCLGCRFKTAVVLVHAVEPQRLVAPRVGRREHQLGCHVVEVDHVRLALEWTGVLDRERQYLPSVGEAYRRRAYALVELVLHALAVGNRYRIVLYHRGLRHPEGYDVVEVAAHGRDETLVIRLSAVEQGIGETVLLDRVLDNVAGLECADLDHDLASSPIYGTCRGRVVEHVGDGNLVDAAVSVVDLHRGEACGCRQGVIVVLQYAVGQGTLRIADEYGAVDVEGPRSRLGNLDGRAVDEAHGGTRLQCRVGFGLCLELKPLLCRCGVTQRQKENQ